MNSPTFSPQDNCAENPDSFTENENLPTQIQAC